MENENIERNKKGFIKNMRNCIRLLIVVAILAIIVVIIFCMKTVVFRDKDGQVTTISESSLERIIEIGELSTVDYTYNAIAKVYDEEGTTVKYYVAYEGIVTAGIDFEKININVDEEQKKVRIIIPDVEIHNVNVDMGTMEYIFTKNKYETETISQEAYKICKQDLQSRVKEERDLYGMAKENAIASVRALFLPWIEQMDKGYTVEVN